MRRFELITVALFLTMAGCLKVHGMAGDLTSPSLAMPADTPEAFRTNLVSVLRESDCKFLSGSFINASTRLQYGGSTESLNRLIAKLSAIDGVRLTVSFAKEVSAVSWTVFHSGWADPGEIQIQINWAASGIKMDDLRVTVTGRSTRVDASSRLK